MDKWKDTELEKMKVLSITHKLTVQGLWWCCKPSLEILFLSFFFTQVGGNDKARNFLRTQSDYRQGMPIQEKYNTKAAALYRDKVHQATTLCEARPTFRVFGATLACATSEHTTIVKPMQSRLALLW